MKAEGVHLIEIYDFHFPVCFIVTSLQFGLVRLQLNINISDLSEQWTEHQGHQQPDLAQILMFASK